MVPNMIAYAFGVPRDIGGISSWLAMVGSVHFWRQPNSSVAFLYTPLPVYLLIEYSARGVLLMN